MHVGPFFIIAQAVSLMLRLTLWHMYDDLMRFNSVESISYLNECQDTLQCIIGNNPISQNFRIIV